MARYFILILCALLFRQIAIAQIAESESEYPRKITLENKSDAISLIKLSNGDCHTSNDNVKVCFIGILEDSRCPPDVQCMWAGNAKLDLELTSSDTKIIRFELNTNLRFRKDTTIGSSYILLEGVSGKAKNPKVAKLFIADLDKLESNAQIIGFNTNSGCNYGFQITMGKDTIVSNDYKIRNLVSKKVDSQIDIYIDLGNKDRSCSNNDGLVKYHVNRIALANDTGM